MQIEIRAKAKKNLMEIAEYIESVNTPGSGDRWLNKFFDRISTYAMPRIKYPLCRNRKLAGKKFSCLTYKNWVVAFKIYKGRFIIYDVIFGPILH